MRECRICKLKKKNSEFYKRKNGLRSECIECDRPLLRNRKLKKKYGITSQEFDLRLAAQGGVCAICHGDGVGDRFVMDHSHSSGKIRSVLCNTCNLILGYCNDKIEILENCITYIKEHQWENNEQIVS